MAGKKRLFTGLQPSGTLHLGNYFGALKPFVDSYLGYESFLMVADYHSLTSLKKPRELRANIVEIVRAYLAVGVNPSRVVLFKQSDVPEHTELAWIFETLVTVPFLMQAHAYKDKIARGLEPTAGLFNYPLLMAADILLYDAHVVPVGGDQRQHVEYAREAANKFNALYGQTFIEPTEKILDGVALVPGTDGQKMSKSYKNTIPLFGPKDDLAAAVMSIVTDSSGERPKNVFAIHKLFKNEADLASLYESNRGNYKALKEALVEDIETVLAPMREKYAAISEEEVKKILAEGREKAHTIAAAKMADVRQKIGVSL